MLWGVGVVSWWAQCNGRRGWGKAGKNGVRDERQPNFNGAETPLLVHGPVTGEESEDQRVGEAAQQAQPQHDGLRDEHDERAGPDAQDVLDADAVPVELVGAPDIDFFAVFRTFL